MNFAMFRRAALCSALYEEGWMIDRECERGGSHKNLGGSAHDTQRSRCDLLSLNGATPYMEQGNHLFLRPLTS